jgi:membrane dipeptidase
MPALARAAEFSMAPGGAVDDARVAAVHAASLVLDAHVDLPATLVSGEAGAAVDGARQVDLPKMERGGVDAAVFTVFAWQKAPSPEQDAAAVATGRGKLAAFRRMVDEHAARIGLARSADELEALVAGGRRAAVLGVLNASVLGPDAGLLAEYHAAGLRQLGFTHAGHNAYADSSRPQPGNGDPAARWGGLSPLGRELVPRLNDLGVLIDVSQLSSAALAQVLATSRSPVVASHSAIRARVDVPRNLADDELRAIAGSGGVVCVVAFSSYLKPPPPAFAQAVAELRIRYAAPDDAALARLPADSRDAYQRAYLGLVRALPPATVADLVDAVEHVVRVAGVEHVGLSTDFEHQGGVEGYRSMAAAPAVTRELLRRGWRDADVAKVWGGNWLRVFREAERKAKGR